MVCQLAGIADMEDTITHADLRSQRDAQLVRAAQKGNHETFNELVLLYQEAVYNLAYRMLGDPYSAEDITQDAFIKAYRNLPGFRNGSFRGWLFRIASNACIDVIRRRKRHPIMPIEAEDWSEENFPPLYQGSAAQLSPEQIFLHGEMDQRIQCALNRLDPHQRAVVILVDIQGLDYQEAARSLKIPAGTLKSRLARGRVQLRQLLDR